MKRRGVDLYEHFVFQISRLKINYQHHSPKSSINLSANRALLTAYSSQHPPALVCGEEIDAED